MLEKLVYFISIFSLFFWTIFSNQKSLDEMMVYVEAITILLGVELITSIVWSGKENRKKRQGIYLMLFLLSIGSAISYGASKCEKFTKDLIPLVLVFLITYFLTAYTNWYQSKWLGVFAMIGTLAVLMGALLSKPVNGAHIKLFGILILPLVVLLYLTSISYFLKGHSRRFVRGKVGSLSSKNVLFLLYTMLLFLFIAACNEFNLLILIALLGTTFFWYSIPDFKIRMFYVSICVVTAVMACRFVSHIRDRLLIWLSLPKAVTDKTLSNETERIVYFIKNIKRSGLWGIGPGNLSDVFQSTWDTDHALTRIFYDYGILMGLLVIAAGVLLIRWMTTIRTLSTMEEFWSLGSIIVTGVMLLLNIGSNTGGFITAGVSFPFLSRGLCLNAMFTIFVGFYLGILEKGEKENASKKRKTSKLH